MSPAPLVLVVMGVSGAGKTYVGRKLADALGWRFIEGDDHHPAANRAKMARGEALDDADRAPWLRTLRALIEEQLERGAGAVLACSALKESYRDVLRVDPARVHFVFLDGDAALIEERLRAREGHFMPTSLLPSQLETLEAPSDALVLDAAQSAQRSIERVREHFDLQEKPRMTHPAKKTSVILEGLAFPEGPRWRDGRLWFTDQHAGDVRWVREDGSSQLVAALHDKPSGLGWLPDGTMLVVAMTERRVYARRDDAPGPSSVEGPGPSSVESPGPSSVEGPGPSSVEGWRLHADLHDLASFHCNDMLVDDAGRAYVGNFGYDLHAGAPVAPAELIVIEPGGQARVAATDVIFPNGMAMTPDRRTLIVAETFAHRLRAFDVAGDGRLENPCVWADLGDATPDGICLDAEGAVWVASPFTDDVRRIGPDARVLEVVEPAGRPFACMLGGEDRRTLFVLSSEHDDPEDAARERSGRIEICRVDVGGTGLP